ncbi:hypothetical protein GHT09_019924 [Marmota monax]|uniref:Uncharacterized protein n=1 Tax=Marmota monax TaxID=9995 RepID=A0A834UHI1_MARMO|nr:hypothetical protein GHT09_019924 [Marmota monax]
MALLSWAWKRPMCPAGQAKELERNGEKNKPDPEGSKPALSLDFKQLTFNSESCKDAQVAKARLPRPADSQR